MLYRFRCTVCKYEHDELVSLDRPIVSKCPKCKAKSVKVFCPPMIIMGENWPQYNPQAGKTFKNRREEDVHFDSIGAVKV